MIRHPKTLPDTLAESALTDLKRRHFLRQCSTGLGAMFLGSWRRRFASGGAPRFPAAIRRRRSRRCRRRSRHAHGA